MFTTVTLPFLSKLSVFEVLQTFLRSLCVMCNFLCGDAAVYGKRKRDLLTLMFSVLLQMNSKSVTFNVLFCGLFLVSYKLFGLYL